jgi:hypothetical protein
MKAELQRGRMWELRVCVLDNYNNNININGVNVNLPRAPERKVTIVKTLNVTRASVVTARLGRGLDCRPRVSDRTHNPDQLV